MSDYRLFETDRFRRDLERLGPPGGSGDRKVPHKDYLDTFVASKRIRSTLERRVYPVLRATPRQAPNAARLREWESPSWRIRIGPWRVFYEIDDTKRIVSLTATDHRKGAHP